MATGKDHEAEGRLDQAKGALKEGWGALTGDRSTEIEGKLERAKGNLQERLGRAKSELEENDIDSGVSSEDVRDRGVDRRR